MRAHGIKEMSVMRHNDYRSLIVKDEILKPCNCFYIEVICRLIKKDYARVAEKCLCKQHLYLFITRK